jgi:uncharacterized membrane protein YeaQ/YmgE (transglycosylase-associated protein family)
VLFVIAAAVGALGQAVAGYSLGGCLVSGIVGLIGAVIGNWLARALGLPEPLLVNIQGQQFPIIWSVVGSAIFVAVVGVLTRRRRRQ